MPAPQERLPDSDSTVPEAAYARYQSDVPSWLLKTVVFVEAASVTASLVTQRPDIIETSNSTIIGLGVVGYAGHLIGRAMDRVSDH